MLQNILTGYIENALAQAEYDKLEDGTLTTYDVEGSRINC